MTPLRGIVRAAVLGVLAVAIVEAGGALAGQEVRQVIQVQTSGSAGGGTAQGQGPLPMSSVDQNGRGLIVGQVVEAGSDRGVPGAIVTLGGATPGALAQVQRFQVMSFGDGGAPLVMNSGGQSLPRLITDSEGRFAFRNLPKGVFNIQATKPGYLDGAYGRLRPNGATQTIELADDERTGDLKVRLFRAASISGTVLDDLGEPVVGVQLRAYRRSLVSGRRLLTAAAGTVQTDDRGMYRLANLVPGEYVVALQTLQSSVPASMQMDGPLMGDLMSTLMTGGGGTFSFSNSGTPVTPDGKFTLQSSNGFAMAGPRGRMLVYPTQYYPSAASASQATPIAVASGEERGGIDLQLKLVPTVNVGGRLIGPDGPAANYALHLVPGDTSELSSDPDIATTITDSNGEFQFLAVPAGQYVIQTVRVPRGIAGGGPARTMMVQNAGGGSVSFTATIDRAGVVTNVAPAAPSEPTLWTATPVSLGDTDITDLLLNLRTGSKITGHVEFDGAAERPPADRLATISVVVESANGKQKSSVPPARVDGNGTFTVYGLLPGKYVMRAANAPGGWTFKGASNGGADLSDTAFDVEDRDITGVALTFFDRPTELRGTVRGSSGLADAAAAVVVFPADTRSWMNYGINPRRMRMARTSRTGMFTFGALPAGDYFLVAVSDEVAGEWTDPQFLDMLSRVGTRVALGEGQKSSQDLVTQNVQPVRMPAPLDEAATVTAHGPFVDSEGSGPDGGRAFRPGAFEQTQSRDTRPQPAAPARDATPTTGTATLAGIVLLDDGSAQPVRRARVTARGSDGRTERLSATDDSGRFSIGALPPGHYTLMVAKPSYLTAYYGAKRPGRGPGVPIALASGQTLTNLSMKMARGAVVSGMVRDDYGLPVAAATVRLMQFRTVNGERTLTGQQSAITDDRGVYRAFGLQPATYVVCATPPATVAGQNEIRELSNAELQAAMSDLRRPPAAGAASPAPNPAGGRGAQAPSQPVGRTVGFAPVYYPGTPLQSDAAGVAVTAGQELTGIDIPLRLVATARVEGSVVGPDGRPASGVSLNLLSSDAGQSGVLSPKFISTNADGKFSITNVAPGRYTLTARGGGSGGAVRFGSGDFVIAAPPPPVGNAGAGGPPLPPPPPPPMPMTPMSTLYATADVEVNGENLTDLTLMLQEGMTVAGRLVFAGKAAPPANLARTRISLVPAMTGGIMMGVPDATIDASGTFKFVGVPPGKYRVISSVPGGGPGNAGGAGASAGWALRSAVVDGRDTLDSALDMRPGQNLQGMVVTFTDQPTEISGTLLDSAGKPTPGFSIVVFSTDRSTWTAGSRRVSPPIQVSSDGKYRTAGLPPGEYFLAALTDYEPGDLGDTAFLEQVAAAAIKITLGEGEKKVQDLKIAG
jgi:protocatechuate 3,4-dioxygenase beta subunit